MDYEKLWNGLKDRLSNMEQYGNLLQQSMGYALLEMIKELEQGAKNTEQQVRPDKPQKCTSPSDYIICGAYDGNGNCRSPKGACRST